MALATGDHRQRHHKESHFHLESVPILDIRLFSQSELLSLSVCSSSCPSPSQTDTDLFAPKIDRSVFNESAGSRKQTFSRLRLAPPRHNFSPSKPTPASLGPNSEPLEEENSRILCLLKSLFNIQSQAASTSDQEDEDLVPVQVEYAEPFYPPSNDGNTTENVFLQNIPVGIVTCSEIKRKRGRPRKIDQDNWLAGSRYMVIEGKETTVGYESTSDRLNSNANADDNSSCSAIKRKRGRPRKIDQDIWLDWSRYMVIDEKETTVGYESTNEKVNSNTNADDNSSFSAAKRKRGRPRKIDQDNRLAGSRYMATEGEETTVGYESANEKMNSNANVYDNSNYSARKRKRGRPRKNEKNNWIVESNGRIIGENLGNDLVIVNRNGKVVDLVALGSAEDPFGEELRKRTEGMKTKAELLEFLGRLEGEWGMTMKKKRIVDASGLGDVLPMGWKLMLCVKKKASHAWVACRRYIRFFQLYFCPSVYHFLSIGVYLL